MHVDSRHGFLDRANDVRVVVAREGRVNPALEADLGRPPLPSLLRAADDLFERDEVRRAAQVLGELSLGEGAEAAAEVAHVRVLDVSGDDVGDLVAAHLAPKPVGGHEDAVCFPAAGPEQARQLVLAELVPREAERKRPELARRPGIVSRMAGRVGRTPDERRHCGIAPALEPGDVLGVDR